MSVYVNIYIYFFFFPVAKQSFFCRTPPRSLPSDVLQNMKVSTVMKCSGNKWCSLYINVNGTVILNENVRGIEICVMTISSSQTQCESVRFSGHKSKKLDGHKVDVQFNCFEVGIAQQVYVTMKTLPNYCYVELEKYHNVEDCDNKDIENNILSCLAGKLDYMVNEEKKSITIHVSDITEGFDYNVRLCLKRFICKDIGAHALIKADNAIRSVTLHYPEILPCLCIEGWSAIPDSRRVRLCPFKNDADSVWNSITYDSVTQTLAWQPLCPVNATVSLCWMIDQNDTCVNFPSSLRTMNDKVLYVQVDPHPRLCAKITTYMDSQVRCPFTNGQFPGWNVNITAVDTLVEIRITSKINASFTVRVCNSTGMTSCNLFALVPVGASSYATLNISSDICGPNLCIQASRSDVTYSVPVNICNIPCKPKEHLPGEASSLETFLLSSVLLILVAMFGFVGCILLSVNYRKQRQEKCYIKSKVNHISLGVASSLEQRLPIMFAQMEDK
uniref:Interleukin 17 receptor E-like n=1 Tax=Xenopus tropicalis TaxID=8364 RepID=A0A803JPG6_XENTR